MILSYPFFLLHVFQDPVCGSAHCGLAPYWSKELGKCDLVAYQVLYHSLYIYIKEQKKKKKKKSTLSFYLNFIMHKS